MPDIIEVLGDSSVSSGSLPFLEDLLTFFSCMNILLACMSMHHVRAWYLWSPKEVSDDLELDL